MKTWNQTPQGREIVRLLAIKREVDRLAQRAGCSADEAAQRRSAGWRYCEKHGWYEQRLCMVCKTEREAKKQEVQRKRAA